MTRIWPVLELRPDMWAQFSDAELRHLLRKRGISLLPSTVPRGELIALLEIMKPPRVRSK